MRFSEYEFDVTRLWDVHEPHAEDPRSPKLTTQPRRPPRNIAAEVVQFPAPVRIVAADAASSDAASCRKQTRAELRSIAMSLKLRDMVRRNGLADRCATCKLCPDMTG